MDTTSDERVCYVHCNFCNTILVVSIPCTSMFNTTILTVRCGHCANFLYVNMQPTLPHPQPVNLQKQSIPVQDYSMKECGSSSKCTKASLLARSAAPLKRQRVPSAYNRFIKDEIQRIKANNPTITHKEAFSTAAKNWAHFPQMQFGLGNNQ